MSRTRLRWGEGFLLMLKLEEEKDRHTSYMQMHFSNYAKLYCDIVYFWKDNSVFWQIFRPIMRNRRGESEPSFTCIETKAFS